MLVFSYTLKSLSVLSFACAKESTKEKYRRIEVINHALQNSFYDSALESCCKMVDCRDVLVASLEITLAL